MLARNLWSKQSQAKSSALPKIPLYILTLLCFMNLRDGMGGGEGVNTTTSLICSFFWEVCKVTIEGSEGFSAYIVCGPQNWAFDA